VGYQTASTKYLEGGPAIFLVPDPERRSGIRLKSFIQRKTIHLKDLSSRATLCWWLRLP
jgi:hypothetical protein